MRGENHDSTKRFNPLQRNKGLVQGRRPLEDHHCRKSEALLWEEAEIHPHRKKIQRDPEEGGRMKEPFELKIGDSIYIRTEADWLENEEALVRILNMLREHYGFQPYPLPVELFKEKDYVRLAKKDFEEVRKAPIADKESGI